MMPTAAIPFPICCPARTISMMNPMTRNDNGRNDDADADADEFKNDDDDLL